MVSVYELHSATAAQTKPFHLDLVFICLECDATGGISYGRHWKTHSLVLCQVQVFPEEPLSIEQKVGAIVSEKFAQVDGQILEVHTKLHQVGERLSRIEDLLAPKVSMNNPRQAVTGHDHVDK